MNIIEIFQLPQAACNVVAALHGTPWAEVICSTTVNTAILAVVLLGAIRLLDPVRTGKRGDAGRRES